MPSSLIEPTGMAPGSGDETLSPLRGLRHDDGERVAGLRKVLPGPVLVGYDGTPEAASLVTWAAACAAGREVVVVHCWRSLDNPRDTAVALRSCVHPQAVARVLEVVREHDAAAHAAAERALATGVALADEGGAHASGIRVALRGERGVAEVLCARVLARRLHVPVVAVPLAGQRKES